MVSMSARSREDSYSMRSIAVVGLIYLPATFVSGIFGTNFFQFGTDQLQKGWKVSEDFWLYWAITVPLTLGTVLIWTCAFHWGAVRGMLGGRWWKGKENRQREKGLVRA
jgi:Mg2+ and Co2+ transporter CorA